MGKRSEADAGSRILAEDPAPQRAVAVEYQGLVEVGSEATRRVVDLRRELVQERRCERRPEALVGPHIVSVGPAKLRADGAARD